MKSVFKYGRFSNLFSVADAGAVGLHKFILRRIISCYITRDRDVFKAYNFPHKGNLEFNFKKVNFGTYTELGFTDGLSRNF